MKKIYFILPPVLLVVFYIAYVLPFGLDQDKFEERFDLAELKIQSFTKDYSRIVKIEDFIFKSNEVISSTKEVETLKKEFSTLNEKRDFFRDTFWKKQTVFQDNFEQLETIFDQLSADLPNFLSNTVSKHSSNVTSTDITASNISSVNKNLSDYKGILISLTENLNSLNQALDDSIRLSDDDLSVIKANNTNLAKMANEARPILKNEILERIKSSNSVNAINGDIRNFTNFLSESAKLYGTLSEIGVDNSIVSRSFKRVQQDNTYINGITQVLKSTVDSQTKSNALLKDALKTMDAANSKLNRMEKFASSSDIMTVYNSWTQAEREVKSSKSPLYKGFNSSTHQTIWNNVNRKAKDNIDKILVAVSKHKNFVYQEYSKARREESTFTGSVTRSTQRGLNRLRNAFNSAVNQAASSRIVRELSLSAKMLVLGTKAFYDLSDPNTDPLTWAMSYENDVNAIMQESEEIMEMDGPSLTGKNTFIEDYVNKAYESSFNNL